jgi:elongation factor 2
MKRVMHAWLPAGEVLLDMLVLHLPSPASAQRYHVGNLYDGPLDDPRANAIQNCDADGPMMIYIAEMVAAGDRTCKMYAFGCVFSSKITSCKKVSVTCGRNEDVFVTSVQCTTMCMEKIFQSVDSVPCGNTIALMGLDNVIAKTVMLTDAREVTAGIIKPLKFSVASIVRKSVDCRPTETIEAPGTPHES